MHRRFIYTVRALFIQCFIYTVLYLYSALFMYFIYTVLYLYSTCMRICFVLCLLFIDNCESDIFVINTRHSSLDSCNNKDIILILSYNYNIIFIHKHTHTFFFMPITIRFCKAFVYASPYPSTLANANPTSIHTYVDEQQFQKLKYQSKYYILLCQLITKKLPPFKDVFPQQYYYSIVFLLLRK